MIVQLPSHSCFKLAFNCRAAIVTTMHCCTLPQDRTCLVAFYNNRFVPSNFLYLHVLYFLVCKKSRRIEVGFSHCVWPKKYYYLKDNTSHWVLFPHGWKGYLRTLDTRLLDQFFPCGRWIKIYVVSEEAVFSQSLWYNYLVCKVWAFLVN